jgi:hypothetical protein
VQTTLVDGVAAGMAVQDEIEVGSEIAKDTQYVQVAHYIYKSTLCLDFGMWQTGIAFWSKPRRDNRKLKLMAVNQLNR